MLNRNRDLWARCPWIVIENDPDLTAPLVISADNGRTLLVIVDAGENVTDDDRSFAAHLAQLHNSKLKQQSPSVGRERW